MLRYITLLALITIDPISQAQNRSAKEIIEKADDRETGDSATFNINMLLIDKGGKQKIRQLTIFSKKYNSATKAATFLKSPPDLRNTSYLVYDWEKSSKANDSWLYLPELGKTKRIVANDQGNPFLGSDFSYADLGGLKYEDWTYKFVSKNESVDGHAAWLIEGRPKKSIRNKVIRNTGYSKIQTWVRKDNFVIAKAKYWVKKGRKIKYLTTKDIRKVDGIWTIFDSQMVTTSNGKLEHTTINRITDVKYNTPLNDKIFSLSRLSKGI